MSRRFVWLSVFATVCAIVVVAQLFPQPRAAGATTSTATSTIPQSDVVPFPSTSVGVVAADLSRRDVEHTGVERVAVIDEQGQLIRIEGALIYHGRRYTLPATGGPTPPGEAVFDLHIPAADKKLLSGCGSVSIRVAGYENGSAPIATDQEPLVADQPKCPRLPKTVAPLTPPTGQPGIDGPMSLESESASQLATDMHNAVWLGAKWIRIAVEWKYVQQNGPGTFNWAPVDRAVLAATRVGLHTLGEIETAPPWASPPGGNYPHDPVQFATFAARVAARYAPYGVRHWEIWNEPNFAQFWSPFVDPAAYARLLRITSVAIHAVEPQSVVLFGGLGRTDFDGTSVSPNLFLSVALADGVLPETNGFAVDPYSYPYLPQQSTTSTRNSYSLITEPTDGILALLKDYGQANKQLWITEFGAPSQGVPANGSPGGVGLAGQAQQITSIFSAVRSATWGGPVFIYDLRDDASSGEDSQDFFGLLTHAGKPKPAAYAYRAAAGLG